MPNRQPKPRSEIRAEKREEAKQRAIASSKAMHVRLVSYLVRGASDGLTNYELAYTYDMNPLMVQNLLYAWHINRPKYRAAVLECSSAGYKIDTWESL